LKIVQIKGQVLFKGEIITKMQKIGWGHLKIFFSRSTMPEKLRFTLKLPEILQTQVCTNHGPWGLNGARMEKTIFTRVYIGKNLFSRTSRPISIKLNINHS
jgi:hypothetical protein